MTTRPWYETLQGRYRSSPAGRLLAIRRRVRRAAGVEHKSPPIEVTDSADAPAQAGERAAGKVWLRDYKKSTWRVTVGWAWLHAHLPGEDWALLCAHRVMGRGINERWDVPNLRKRQARKPRRR